MRTIICDASDRERWLKERSTRVTGSDTAVMMKISDKFKSYDELLVEKATGSLGEIPDNSNMFWGRKFEDAIGAAFCEALRCRRKPCHYLVGYGKGDKLAATLDNLVVPDLAYSNDDIVDVASRYGGKFGVDEWMPELRSKVVELYKRYGVGVLEIKNTSIFGTSTWKKEIPDYYVPQTQQQLMCTGAKWGVIAACLGGSNLMAHVYVADSDFHRQIISDSDAFWREVGRIF